MEPAGAAPRSTFSRFGIHQPVHVIPGGLNSSRKSEGRVARASVDQPGMCKWAPASPQALWETRATAPPPPVWLPQQGHQPSGPWARVGATPTEYFPHPPLPPSPRILLFSTSVGRFLERHAPRTVNEARRPRSECGRRDPPAPTLRTGSRLELRYNPKTRPEEMFVMREVQNLKRYVVSSAPRCGRLPAWRDP